MIVVAVCVALYNPVFGAGSAEPEATAVTPPPTGVDADYQLGAPRTVPDNVGIVVRDRAAQPRKRIYNVCYINGFQTQPHEASFWQRRPELILRKNGKPVVDAGWGEILLDTRTKAKRNRIASIMGIWARGCAAAGFDAVEFDNLDSFYRSKGLIKQGHNRALAKLLATRAHDAGLAVAQKNWAEWDGTTAGYDFAIAEECGRYDECGSYVANHGDRVVVVEYRKADFDKSCAEWGDQLAVVLRDRALARDGRRSWCPE